MEKRRNDYVATPPGGMTFDEIAEILGMTKPNVWRIFRQAMEKLRRTHSERKLRALLAMAEAARTNEDLWPFE